MQSVRAEVPVRHQLLVGPALLCLGEYHRQLTTPPLLDLSAAVDVYSEWVDAAGTCLRMDPLTVTRFNHDGLLIYFQTPSRKKTLAIKNQADKEHGSLWPAQTKTKTTADTREKESWRTMMITEALLPIYIYTHLILPSSIFIRGHPDVSIIPRYTFNRCQVVFTIGRLKL